MNTLPTTPPPSQLSPGSSQPFTINDIFEFASQNQAINSVNSCKKVKKLSTKELVSQMSQIPDLKTVKFKPLEMNPASPPVINISEGIDRDSPLSLFLLLLPPSLWYKIVWNTDTYTL